MIDEEEHWWYLRQAQVRWESYECQVGDNAMVVGDQSGAWVEAWVWIDAPNYFDEESIVDALAEEE